MSSTGTKVIFLGESGVGKTSVISMAVNNKFQREHIATVGASFSPKLMVIDGNSVNLQLWDTAGQEKYHSIAPLFFHSSKVAVIVFALDDIDSFDCVSQWYQMIRDHEKSDIKFYLVGNKNDCVDTRAIPFSECAKKATELKMKYFEVSAMNGVGIEDLFDSIARDTITLSNSTTQIVEKPESEKKKSGC